MSHRRRLLNLIMGNKGTGVCTLHHIDLHSCKNNLFYPSAAAAAAKDPSFFSTALETMKRIRPGEPRMSFQSTPPADYPYYRRRRRRREESQRRRQYLLRRDWAHDNDVPRRRRQGRRRPQQPVPVPGLDTQQGVAPRLSQLESLALRRAPAAGYDDTATGIVSYGMVGGLVCLSTEGVGTYCFDMLTRTWTKAGDWALPFSGKIEHVPELGVLVGFPTWTWNGNHRVCASLLTCVRTLTPWTLSATVVGRRPELCEAYASLEPPDAWESVQETRLVSLGGGKLCAVQSFESKKDACASCRREDVDKRFAIFTGLEVVRSGEDDGNGEGGIRVIRHKSKRYMLADGDYDDENIFIASVL
ncbi:unnamed protein product [Urochloa decumbens]|uniref:Uncharacterized protein n=1 Tax=Urochloa decumbens TaxID=240449 RepID=A0ABC9B600_9POAL